MIHQIFNAVYVAIFVQFVRKIIDRCTVPFEVDIEVEIRRPEAEEWFVTVNGHPYYWSGDLDDAKAFIYAACARRRSLGGKMKIVQTDDELVLVSAESCGCDPYECSALDLTVDEFG